MPSQHKSLLVTLACCILLISSPAAGRRTTNAQPAANTLTIVNASSKEIHRLYVSVSGAPTWGPDLLGRNILYPGQSKSLGDLAGSQYDVMIVDADRRECVMRNVPSNSTLRLTEPLLASNCRR